MVATTLSLQVNNGDLLQALALAPRTLERNMSREIQRIIQMMARTGREYAPKAFSLLTNSILPVMVTSLHGEVRTGTNYALPVEDGTGIHGPEGRPSGKMPPLDDLISWIKVKQIQPLDPVMDIRDLAFVIGRRIAETGTKSQPYLKPSKQTHTAEAQKRANLAITRTLQAMT